MAKSRARSPRASRQSASRTRSSRRKVLREAGILGLMRPDKARQGRRHLPALGRLAGDRHRHRGASTTRTRRADRRARLAQLRAAAPPLQRARPRLRRDGDRPRRRGRDHVPQPPRLHRGDARRGQARRQRALPEHDVRRPAAGRGDASASSRRRSSTTRSSPACSTGSTTASPASSAWTDERGRRRPTLDSLIAASHDADLKPPPDKPRFVILTSGTTGTPEGRPALQPRRAAARSPR